LKLNTAARRDDQQGRAAYENVSLLKAAFGELSVVEACHACFISFNFQKPHLPRPKAEMMKAPSAAVTSALCKWTYSGYKKLWSTVAAVAQKETPKPKPENTNAKKAS